MNRALAAAVRGFVSTQAVQTAGQIPRAHLIATVTAVAGTTVTVTWRGAPVVASAVASSYTPVVGDRVLCHLADDQLIVAYSLT